ncbi:MAG: hypothetical protein MUF53_07095, partial [Gemmatimonadaceae bacterium]|nr:hypothetical protein [Gemmatimonadaceae bacterium]
NGNMYLCPSANRMYFLEYLTTPNLYIQNRKDANQTNCNRTAGAANQILMSRSTPVTAPPLPADTARITFDNRGSGNTTCCASPANDNRFRDSSQARLGGRLQTRAHGVDSLNLPLPGDSIDPRELIRPRNLSTDGSALQGVKYAWMADWTLTIDWNNIGGLCANITSSAWSARPVGFDVPTGSDCTGIFSAANFWDDREGNRVRVLNINMGALRTWVLADSARRRTEILYITFVGPRRRDPGAAGWDADPAGGAPHERRAPAQPAHGRHQPSAVHPR